MSAMCVEGWCFGGSCSSAINAVANASVITHSSWPVIPFLGIVTVLSPSPATRSHPVQEHFDQARANTVPGKISRRTRRLQDRSASHCRFMRQHPEIGIARPPAVEGLFFGELSAARDRGNLV